MLGRVSAQRCESNVRVTVGEHRRVSGRGGGQEFLEVMTLEGRGGISQAKKWNWQGCCWNSSMGGNRKARNSSFADGAAGTLILLKSDGEWRSRLWAGFVSN